MIILCYSHISKKGDEFIQRTMVRMGENLFEVVRFETYNEAKADRFLEDPIYALIFLKFTESNDGKAFIEEKINDENDENK